MDVAISSECIHHYIYMQHIFWKMKTEFHKLLFCCCVYMLKPEADSLAHSNMASEKQLFQFLT